MYSWLPYFLKKFKRNDGHLSNSPTFLFQHIPMVNKHFYFLQMATHPTTKTGAIKKVIVSFKTDIKIKSFSSDYRKTS